jgi:hypothetical protein
MMHIATSWYIFEIRHVRSSGLRFHEAASTLWVEVQPTRIGVQQMHLSMQQTQLSAQQVHCSEQQVQTCDVRKLIVAIVCVFFSDVHTLLFLLPNDPGKMIQQKGIQFFKVQPL